MGVIQMGSPMRHAPGLGRSVPGIHTNRIKACALFKTNYYGDL